MLSLDNKNFSKPYIYSIWLLMAFQAGYVNVGGFFVSKNFVSHVTGTSSNIGMNLANGNFSFVITFLTVLLSFIAGAAFAGHHIERPQREGTKPRFILVTAVKCFFFAMVLLLSELDLFHLKWVSMALIQHFMIFFLSFCCGIQNATCSLATGGFLKPTHMTGLSTDLGIGLARFFSSSKRQQKETTQTYLRLSILLSFIFGGCIAGIIFSYNGHYGFLFPFFSSLCFVLTSAIPALRNRARTKLLGVAKGSIIMTFALTVMFGINEFLQ